jgi:phospholipase/carboxylesterase
MEIVRRIRPAAGEPEGLLVLFHGRGSDEHDLVAVLDLLDPDRRLLGVTPGGPLALPPGGRHWYAVHRIGFPDPATFLPTFAAVADWLDALAEETGIPAGRTALGGFSQGAVMTFALGLAAGRPRPAALVPLSGFIPTVAGFELDLAGAPPIALGHGSYDDVIPVSFAHEARARLDAAGAALLYRESPYPHAIDPAFLRDEVAPWLARLLA